MRMIKVGEKYLGLVDRQGDAIRFEYPRNELLDVAVNIDPLARVVKLTTLADRTAASMRGLADDVAGDK